MDTVLESTLDMYKDQHNGTVPEEIIIYRSGVDEGSYALIISEEIPRVHSILSAKGAADAKLVFIVAQKEHNVRLFKEQMTMNELEGLTFAFAHDHQIVALATSLTTPVYIANRYAERDSADEQKRRKSRIIGWSAATF